MMNCRHRGWGGLRSERAFLSTCRSAARRWKQTLNGGIGHFASALGSGSTKKLMLSKTHPAIEPIAVITGSPGEVDQLLDIQSEHFNSDRGEFFNRCPLSG